MSQPIRLLLADDQALVRGALAALLELESDISVVAQVGRGDEVVAAARANEPDVALLDVEMPGLDGIAATAALHEALPGCRVLMVTTFGRPGYLRRAMEAGASGFVVKDTPARELADAVRRVHTGLRVVDPALAAETLATALTRYGIDYDIKEYPGASHAFMNEVTTDPPWYMRPLLRVVGIRPDPSASTDAWMRIDGFFSRHLR